MREADANVACMPHTVFNSSFRWGRNSYPISPLDRWVGDRKIVVPAAMAEERSSLLACSFRIVFAGQPDKNFFDLDQIQRLRWGRFGDPHLVYTVSEVLRIIPKGRRGFRRAFEVFNRCRTNDLPGGRRCKFPVFGLQGIHNLIPERHSHNIEHMHLAILRGPALLKRKLTVSLI